MWGINIELNEEDRMKLLKEDTYQFKQKLYLRKFPINGLLLDYVFFEETGYRGYSSHRKAALEFIKVMNEKRNIPGLLYTDLHYFDHLPIVCSPIRLSYAVNPELMYGKRIKADVFFSVEKTASGSYLNWYAQTFLFPPYSYSGDEEDFISLNKLLFPKKSALIIYAWNNNWSNYFSPGREWMDAFLWTIYDTASNKLTVIGSSMTD